MATHDYVIASGTGAAVRSDLNGALAAIVSNNSSATAPGTMYAYQWWADTTAGVMKMRNGANNAWISLYELDGTFLAGDISLSAGAAATPSLFFTGDPNTGIYSPGADQLAISTSGTGRITFDASGNVNIDSNTLYVDAVNNRVGIGTTPVVDLDVAPAASTATFRIHARSSTTPVAAIELVRGTSTTFGADGSGDYRIKNDSGNLSFEYGDSGVTSQRASIDSSGRLLVGVIASPAHQLQVSTDSAGKPSTNTWTIVSDERIKEDIELADLSLCYQAVKDTPLKRYKWKDAVYTEEQVHDRHKLGWISQDVKAVFPKAVRISEFKYNQVFDEETGELISEDIIEDCHDLNVDQLYAAMYGAVQMLMAKVETLEASNADMLARLSALEGATG